MIAVKVSKDNFEYDVHSLVKAFYPAEDVKVYVAGEKEVISENAPEIEIVYGDNSSEIKIYEHTKAGNCNESEEDEHTKVGNCNESEEDEHTKAGNCSEIREDEYSKRKSADEEERTLVISMQSDKAFYDDRTAYKNSLKQVIYKALSQYTGKLLPWGTLTGIRPTKIAVTMINEGTLDDEVIKHYKDVYLASEEKAKLAIDIAHRELSILSKINYEKGYSLYIGIPFCPTTCLYCSFTSFSRSLYAKMIPDYIACLKKEIDYVADAFADKVLDSVYIGGGTPTTLEAAELEDLIGYLKSKLDMAAVKEFTVEAGRADSITEDKMRVLKQMGVTRISVNPQTFKQETLNLIGRRHTTEQVIDAYNLARSMGFDNINMDLIMGLPGESKEDVEATLKKCMELGPDSLTVHSLAVKRASKLGAWIEENGIERINNTDEIMQMCADYAEKMGVNPYYMYRQKNMSGNLENVGYAAESKEGLYNILIMEEVQTIVAIGAGVVSKRVFGDGRIERCDNVKDVGLYISKIAEMIDRKRELFK